MLTYGKYTKLSDIFERYGIPFFDQEMVNFLISECAKFLQERGVANTAIKDFIIQFYVKADNTYVGISGGNLMSALWLCDIYPPNPEKYISNNVYTFQGKKYIYDPTDKSLKIKKYATKRNRSKTYN